MTLRDVNAEGIMITSLCCILIVFASPCTRVSRIQRRAHVVEMYLVAQTCTVILQLQAAAEDARGMLFVILS